MWYHISSTISLLRRITTFATLISFRLKSFNCGTTVKILIHSKYVKINIEIAKGLAKTSQQTTKQQDVFILKIWSTNDLKRDNFIVFKMKRVIQKVHSLRRRRGGRGESHRKTNKNEKGEGILACMYVCAFCFFLKNAEIFKMKFYSYSPVVLIDYNHSMRY